VYPVSLPTFEARMDERDARECRRREKESLAMTALPSEELPAALEREAERREQFRKDKELLLQARRTAVLAKRSKGAGPGTFRSDSPNSENQINA
jgi:hypothetical protein